ncbi:MAG: prolyl-tRNA editing protein [Deltaproteobacteria bacterium RBG_13_49_15]|nr:MAG: prolyl-tRNA editing protein [Deltaproteobacteria bacterium RBG_13_49_15]
MEPTKEKKLRQSAQKVQDILISEGFSYEVVEMEETTRSAADAAKAVGCEVGQIVKSLIFRGKTTGATYLVLVSGANRVDEKKLARHLSEPVKMADADFVRKATGYVIGGVPPLGHLISMKAIIDMDLLGYREIWAAAGTPYAVFKLTPDDLKRMTQGQVISIS